MHKKITAYLNSLAFYKLKGKTSAIVKNIFLYLFVFTVGYVIIFPFIDMISAAFTNPSDLGNPSSVYIPYEFSTISFQIANDLVKFSSTMIITLLYTGLITFLQVVSCSFVGYGFSRFKFRGRNVLFFLVILTIVIPPQALMIPEYLSLRFFDVFGILEATTGETLNLLSSPIVLAIKPILGVGIRSGLFIFIFRQFFMNVPKELEEAALVDGAGIFKTYFKIMIPTSMPAIMTVAIFSFVWNYSDTAVSTFLSKSVLFSQRLLNNLEGSEIASSFAELMGLPASGQSTSPLLVDAVQDAAILVFLLPLLILYFLIQKKFVENFERAGIVG